MRKSRHETIAETSEKSPQDEGSSKLRGNKSNAEICDKYYRKYGEYRGKRGSVSDRMQSPERASEFLRGHRLKIYLFQYLYLYLRDSRTRACN